MAANKDNNLIGYDPLAWLGLETADAESADEQLQPEASANDLQTDEFGADSIDNFEELTEDITSIEMPVEDNEAEIKNNMSNADSVTTIDDAIDTENISLEEQGAPTEDELGDSETVTDDLMDAAHGAVADDPMDGGGRATHGAVAETEDVSIDVESIAIEENIDVSEENNDWVDAMTEQEISPMVDLGATLTIQHVGELHEKLKLCLAMHDQIEINASDVSAIDTAHLQLLVALKKDAANLQKQVSIIYPSPRFVESAQLLGLLDLLEVTP